MENRFAYSLIDPKNCNLVADVKEGKLCFTVNDKDHYSDSYKGELKRAAILSEFGINEEKFKGDKELAKFFRKMEFYFVDSAANKHIVDKLMKFKAKVEAKIEKEKDLKGNFRLLYENTVETEIPDSFVMKAPLFEGYEPIEFTVLIGAEADTQGVKFFLESNELFKLEEEEKRRLIGIEVERFKKFGCAILHK
jgi:hypothetical protein